MDDRSPTGGTPATESRPADRHWLDRLQRGTGWRLAVILAAALALGLGLRDLLQALFEPLLLLLGAIVVAVALDPLVARAERRLPRVGAILLLYAVLFLVLGGLGWLMVPPLIEQGQAIAEQAPATVEEGERQLEESELLPFSRQELRERAEGLARQLGAVGADLALRAIAGATGILLVWAMAAYLLASGPALLRYLLSHWPPAQRGQVEDVLREMGQTMGGFVRGWVLAAMIVGVLTYVGLLIIGVKYALMLAVVAGLLELIPVLGPLIAAVPAIAVALTDSWGTALMVLLFYIALQQFENYVLLPNILYKQAHIPPLLTLVALVVGASLGGVFGALLAVPVSGALRIFILRMVSPAIRRWTGADPTDGTGR